MEAVDLVDKHVSETLWSLGLNLIGTRLGSLHSGVLAREIRVNEFRNRHELIVRVLYSQSKKAFT